MIVREDCGDGAPPAARDKRRRQRDLDGISDASQQGTLIIASHPLSRLLRRHARLSRHLRRAQYIHTPARSKRIIARHSKPLRERALV